MNNYADINIIGNGIIGLLSAFRINQLDSSIKINIIGNENRQGSATFAAGAMLNSFAELEKDGLNNKFDRIKFDLSIEATKQWINLEESLKSFKKKNNESNQNKFYLGNKKNGSYIVNNTASNNFDDENFEAILKGLLKYKQSFKLINPEKIPNYKPKQRQRATRAIFIPNEGWYNPHLIFEKVYSILSKEKNVKFINSNVKLINHKRNKILSIILDTKLEIKGDKFLLCPGASISNLIKESNLKISLQRIFYGVGTSIELKNVENHFHNDCIRTPNRGLACGIYTVPYNYDKITKRNHVLVRATNYISHKPIFSPRASNVSSILNSVINQINTNFEKSEIVKINVGWRPTSSDTYPLIGKTNSYKNLFIVSGTKREGYHLSPVISEIIANQIVSNKKNKILNIFHPERKLIRSLTRENAIQKALDHLISAAYQHDFIPSDENLEKTLKIAYLDELNALHDKFKAFDWGIPVEMIQMYKYGHIK